MRLIDADAAKYWAVNNLTHSPTIQKIHVALNDLPTIDPVHAAGVCYCRECKHRENCDRQTTRFFAEPTFEATRCEYHELEFCSNGEKEEANGEAS